MAPSMSPDYYIAAIGLGVVAALVMFRAEVTTVLTAVVATIVVVIMVALGAHWWRGFHGSRVNNLGLSSQSMKHKIIVKVTLITSNSWKVLLGSRRCTAN